MTLTEPSSVLFETGVLATLEKADGSVDGVDVRGLLEEAANDRPSGDTRRAASEWHFTCSTAEAGTTFEEGDSLTIDSDAYEILDVAAQDAATTIFLITPAT